MGHHNFNMAGTGLPYSSLSALSFALHSICMFGSLLVAMLNEELRLGPGSRIEALAPLHLKGGTLDAEDFGRALDAGRPSRKQ